MSNLSDLLPAGAAAKQLTFTDSGSGIASKKPVVIESDGEVTQVAGSTITTSAGAESTFDSAAITSFVDATYDTANDRVVMIWRTSAAGDYGYAAVGAVSGTSISWGTRVAFNSAVTSLGTIAYDASAEKVVIAFNSTVTGSNVGYAIVGTVDPSDNSISFGTKNNFISGEYNTASIVYDISASKCLLSFIDQGDNYYGKCTVISISGTSISFGSLAAFENSNLRSVSSAYSTAASKTAISYRDLGSGDQQAVVASVSGTSVSFGTIVQASSNYYTTSTAAYDANADRVVFAGKAGGASSHGKAVVGTISGTSISFGSEVTFESSAIAYQSAVYDSLAKTTNILYALDAVSRLGEMAAGTVSGTSITFATAFEFHGNPTMQLGATFDSDTNQTIVGYKGTSDYGEAKAIVTGREATNLTATNFVGVADSAISASAAGSVIVQGGTVSGVSSGTGLSMGATAQYSASNLADIYASQAVFDSTNNKMVIVYDGAGSGAGYGIVGTISGTSISYGSAVQYSGGNAQHSQATYDSTNQRVVVAYADSANSGYLTAAVGTVSGTSISWGTPVVADSTANDFYIGIDFDINAGKVLIIWKDNSTAYNYSIVGTVSGTSISFGTKVAIDTTYGYQQIGGLTYDPNAQKHLFTRPRTSGSVTDSYVGTVSGTSVSWGSAVSLTTTQYFYDVFSAYEAPSQKLGVVFTNASDSTLGTLVATISGTSVSYGSLVNVGAGAYTAPGVYYDATAGEFIAQGKLSNNLLAYRGTLSGTTISWGAAQTVAADADFGSNVGIPGYDTNAGKGLFQWANAGATAADSGVATIGDLPLTVGTKYYVTTTGGFSSSAGDPSVNAGLAISTTSLLLNGDS